MRKEAEARAEELLKILGLYEVRYEMATSLPYGDQRKVEICRALAIEPKLLLLDEPAAGMNEVETEELRTIVHKLREMGNTILLIEHDMRFVMNICDRLYVLNDGALIAEVRPTRCGQIRSSSKPILERMNEMSLLRLEKVVVDYGSIHALKEIDIDVNTGEVITLIGANGAGKSTTMKAIMGLIPVKSGKIWFDGKEITNLDTKNMVQSGIILFPGGPAGVSALLGHG